MKQVIQLGESIRLYASYTDVDTGAPVDPLAITCTILMPDKLTELVITIPDDDIVQAASGLYFVKFTSTAIGTHRYAIVAQISASENDVRSGKFDVEAAI